MTSALFDYTYEDDDDPMLTNILNGNLLSEHHTFYDLPERYLLDIAGEHTPQMLAGFSTFSERNRAFFAPIVWPSALVSLPDELLGHIAENLPTVDLLTLTLTSKKLRHASIPSIYRDVDLSIHNRGRLVYGSKQEDNYLWQYSSSYRCEDVRSRAFTRQEQFLQQVIEHPEYAKYVKSLSWTLLLLREPEWGEDYPTESAVIAERPILHIWEVFEKLTNVRWLDLAWLSHDHDRPLASQFPDVLFPRASSIRLSGVMEYALVASILASDPSKLQDLIWDNVQQPAKATYQLTIPRQPYHQQTLSPWNNLAPFNGNINSYLSAAGPMVNLLGSLAGRCTNLTSLELHKTAERGPRHTQESSEFTPAYSARDEDIYVEWAHFLVSVKSTLEDIVWEQGQCDFKLRSRVLRRGAWPLIRLMDVRFESQIWPLITGQAHDWPCLKRLTVRGVRSMFGGTFVRHRDFRDHILDALWEKFGNELEIQLEGVREGVLEHIGMEVRS